VPFTFEMRSTDHLALCRGWGDFDVREAVVLARSLVDHGLSDDCDLVLDVRERSGVPAETEIPVFVEALRRFREGFLGRVSLVTGEPHLYGTSGGARPGASAGADGVEWSAFRSLEGALEWIRRPRAGTSRR